jgi:hypothetical protein
MLEIIEPADIDLDGKALAVSYRPDPQQPQLVLVDVAAHATEAEASHICKSELSLVVVHERMTKEAMHARVADEAFKRGIERVAWIGCRPPQAHSTPDPGR